MEAKNVQKIEKSLRCLNGSNNSIYFHYGSMNFMDKSVNHGL